MAEVLDDQVYDYVVIGSGFGGSVAAMRLTEKGYSVLVLEKGRRFEDEDFATTNWQVWKYLWMPALRWYGILQLTPFRNVVVLHGSGVGGGSLGYANVLTEPDGKLFDVTGWRDLADWKQMLKPHYATAKRMLGVTSNPCVWPADRVLKEIADRDGPRRVLAADERRHVLRPRGRRRCPTRTSAARGRRAAAARTAAPAWSAAVTTPRTRCVKNYLYFAEKWGARGSPPKRT